MESCRKLLFPAKQYPFFISGSSQENCLAIRIFRLNYFVLSSSRGVHAKHTSRGIVFQTSCNGRNEQRGAGRREGTAVAQGGANGWPRSRAARRHDLSGTGRGSASGSTASHAVNGCSAIVLQSQRRADAGRAHRLGRRDPVGTGSTSSIAAILEPRTPP